MAWNDRMDFVYRTLREALPGLKVRRREAWSEPDSCGFAAELPGARLVVEIKALAQLRVQDLVGQLAVGAVQAEHRIGKRGALPLVVVVAPTVGGRALQAAERFMASYLPQIGWAVLDRRGRVQLRIPTLDIDRQRRSAPPATGRGARPEGRLFSDLNRWLLKILLLSGLDRSLWAGPAGGIHGAADLQRAAAVSLDKVYKFLRLMERHDFLRRTPDGLRLVRKRELIELWFAQEKLRPARRLQARSLFGSRPVLTSLAASGAGREAGVLGGFGACKALGVLHAAVDSTDLHIAMPEEAFLKRFELERCDERDAQLHLLRTNNPQSVFRASVVKGKVQVVDAFQAALDVITHPARGREQAEHIVELVLKAGAE